MLRSTLVDLVVLAGVSIGFSPAWAGGDRVAEIIRECKEARLLAHEDPLVRALAEWERLSNGRAARPKKFCQRPPWRRRK